MSTLQEQSNEHSVSTSILAQSSAMREVLDEIQRAAPTDATVLVTGESGTGKKLVAQAIHRNSHRSQGPFVPVNIAAIPQTLVESELFGSLESTRDSGQSPPAGCFAAAAGGTLFLEDVSDLPLAVQARLVRLLDQRTVPSRGSSDDRRIDIRLVAATGRNLKKLVAEGGFREDLFQCLSAVTISLPPLRRRREDVPLLVERFLDDLGQIHGKPQLVAAPELIHILQSQDWPGNVRQLRNCVESMVVRSHASILTAEDLPASIRESHQDAPPRFELPEGVTLADIVKAAVLQTLDRLEGNRTQAAQSLGISVRTLQRKLKQWQNSPSSAAQDEPSKRWETIGTS